MSVEIRKEVEKADSPLTPPGNSGDEEEVKKSDIGSSDRERSVSSDSQHSGVTKFKKKGKKLAVVDKSRVPSAFDSSHTISSWLMLYNKAKHDAEFSKKACESLVKKLKDKRSDLELFIQTIASDGKKSNLCIPIPRTLDGRLQVAGRKGFPHLTYVRIFRNANVHKNELKHIPACRFAYDFKHESVVCVNPWHYEKVVTSVRFENMAGRAERTSPLSAEEVAPLNGRSASCSPFVHSQPPSFMNSTYPQPTLFNSPSPIVGTSNSAFVALPPNNLFASNCIVKPQPQYVTAPFAVLPSLGNVIRSASAITDNLQALRSPSSFQTVQALSSNSLQDVRTLFNNSHAVLDDSNSHRTSVPLHTLQRSNEFGQLTLPQNQSVIKTVLQQNIQQPFLVPGYTPPNQLFMEQLKIDQGSKEHYSAKVDSENYSTDRPVLRPVPQQSRESQPMDFEEATEQQQPSHQQSHQFKSDRYKSANQHTHQHTSPASQSTTYQSANLPASPYTPINQPNNQENREHQQPKVPHSLSSTRLVQHETSPVATVTENFSFSMCTNTSASASIIHRSSSPRVQYSNQMTIMPNMSVESVNIPSPPFIRDDPYPVPLPSISGPSSQQPRDTPGSRFPSLHHSGSETDLSIDSNLPTPYTPEKRSIRDIGPAYNFREPYNPPQRCLIHGELLPHMPCAALYMIPTIEQIFETYEKQQKGKSCLPWNNGVDKLPLNSSLPLFIPDEDKMDATGVMPNMQMKNEVLINKYGVHVHLDTRYKVDDPELRAIREHIDNSLFGEGGLLTDKISQDLKNKSPEREGSQDKESAQSSYCPIIENIQLNNCSSPKVDSATKTLAPCTLSMYNLQLPDHPSPAKHRKRVKKTRHHRKNDKITFEAEGKTYEFNISEFSSSDEDTDSDTEPAAQRASPKNRTLEKRSPYAYTSNMLKETVEHIRNLKCRQPKKRYERIPNKVELKENSLKVNAYEPPNDTSNSQSIWACIVYYEKRKSVREKQALFNSIYIDGGFGRADNRFSLGLETNADREPNVERIRQYIMQGIRISVKANGDAWIRVFSNQPVFLHSNFLDHESGLGMRQVVHKIYPGGRLKVFDMEFCRKKLKKRRMKQLLSEDYKTGKFDSADAKIKNISDQMFERFCEQGPDELRSECIFSLSFVKGYGKGYPKRPEIWDCETWMEVKMNNAFSYLDKLLQETKWYSLPEK